MLEQKVGHNLFVVVLVERNSALDNLINALQISIRAGLTEFRIDRMAFGQSERTCLNIQNVPLL